MVAVTDVDSSSNGASEPLRVALAADHAGVHLKDELVSYLQSQGIAVTDLGTHGEARVDYPDFGFALGRAVAGGEADLGVAVCGSGLGVCMAANKIHGVRAATVHDVTSARLTREHNNANVICLGERLIGVEVAKDTVDAFLSARFAGGRHAARVAKLDAQ